MDVRNMKQRSVQQHDFSMNPSPEVPRSQFDLSHGKKKPFNFSELVPILCEFALPGDTWNCRINTAARTAVPIVPIMDNWHLEFFSFFCPMRLVWDNAQKFFGEQEDPTDTIAYTIPQMVSPAGGYAVGSLWDHFGLPTVGQVLGGNTFSHNALPFRAYNRIYQDWFRDENLQSKAYIVKGDGPDTASNYATKSRGKRFDPFTQALPWPQKGNTAISIPLGTSAPIKTSASQQVTGVQTPLTWREGASGNFPSTGHKGLITTTATGVTADNTTAPGGAGALTYYPSNLYADLTVASAATINAVRTAITMQQYLERDARGGTRYNEYVWNHYRVRTQDARLNRPEFIGGGYAPIQTTAIPQTSATGLTGGTTPAGTLAASGYAQGGGGFTYSATEHGYVITLACARTDQSYSQGLRRMWTISTRYDIPVPLLANLGEQAMLNKELYCDGSANDNNVFGYVPRFDEYRFIPSEISGIFKPRSAGNIAYWHSSQNFAALPTLNSAFITDDSVTTVQRNFAAGAATLGQQLLADFYFTIKCARALPLYGIPGLTRL